jgi:hypothetical protein
VWMLEEQQVFAGAGPAQRALEDVGVPVSDASEPADAELARGRAQSSAAQSRVSMSRARSCRKADA